MLKNGFRKDSEFVILSRDPEKFLREYPEYAVLSNVRFVAGDVRSFSFFEEKFDSVIHAATPAVTTLPPGEMRSIIIDGTRHVLDFARYCGAKKLLFTSSGAVYGPLPPGMTCVSEDFPCAPVTEYGIAKLEAEKMCLSSGISSRIARCFAFAGPRLALDIHFAIGNFIRNGLNKEDIIVRGDGTPCRSYLYADDLVRWLFAVLDCDIENAVFNVGSPEGVSIAELARRVAGHFSPPPQVRILGTSVSGMPPQIYVPDVSRIQKTLGVIMENDLFRSIEKTIAAHRAGE
jgi:dTDP-glucose 4,6-dehydratase